MEYHLKSILYVIIIVIIVIFLFAIIYWRINQDTIENKYFINNLYTSTTLQTLIGMDEPPTKNSLKILYSIQSIIAYSITIGLIYIILKNTFKPTKIK